MTEEKNIYTELEGQLNAANILASVVIAAGGSVEIEAGKLFAEIQVDRNLILEYNQDNNTYKVSVESLGKDETKFNE